MTSGEPLSIAAVSRCRLGISHLQLGDCNPQEDEEEMKPSSLCVPSSMPPRCAQKKTSFPIWSTHLATQDGQVIVVIFSRLSAQSYGVVGF